MGTIILMPIILMGAYHCNCYPMIKNTLRVDAIMGLTLETTMMSGIQLILNAILFKRNRKKKYR
jgi:hypothetical protein